MDWMSVVGGAGAGDARPTYFELAAQSTLTDLVKPALRQVVAVYAERYPQYLLGLYQWLDEVYAVVTLVIESHYLATTGGAFAEHFYGLKRVATVNAIATRRLDVRDRRRALATIALVPYLYAKAEARFTALGGGLARDVPLQAAEEDARDGAADQAPQRPWRERWRHAARRAFVTWYPRVSSAYALVQLGYQLAFIYGATRYYSPWLHLTGQQITRLTSSDMMAMAADASAQTASLEAKYAGTSLAAVLRRMVVLALHRGLDLVKTLLPLAIFFIKFLEWWYNAGHGKAVIVAAPVPPPPAVLPVRVQSMGAPFTTYGLTFCLPRSPARAARPPTAQRADDGVGVPATRGDCPICRRPRTNPAMIPSGYVFCYPCIHLYVEEHRQCPVTLVATEVDQVRKLYIG